MKEGYKMLGNFIRQVDVRNTEGKEENLLGVSVQKKFIPSIANTVGTDFAKYKVVKRRQFTYIPDTSRRGDKIGIAFLEDYEEGLVSNVYCRCTEELQNEILRQAGYKSNSIQGTRWVQKCIMDLEKDIERYNLGRDYLYDGAKYFHRSYIWQERNSRPTKVK